MSLSRSTLVGVCALAVGSLGVASDGKIPIPFTAPVVAPITISGSGSYVLTRDLPPVAGASTMIDVIVASPNATVTIDLGGFTVDGTGATGAVIQRRGVGRGDRRHDPQRPGHRGRRWDPGDGTGSLARHRGRGDLAFRWCRRSCRRRRVHRRASGLGLRLRGSGGLDRWRRLPGCEGHRQCLPAGRRRCRRLPGGRQHRDLQQHLHRVVPRPLRRRGLDGRSELVPGLSEHHRGIPRPAGWSRRDLPRFGRGL